MHDKLVSMEGVALCGTQQRSSPRLQELRNLDALLRSKKDEALLQAYLRAHKQENDKQGVYDIEKYDFNFEIEYHDPPRKLFVAKLILDKTNYACLGEIDFEKGKFDLKFTALYSAGNKKQELFYEGESRDDQFFFSGIYMVRNTEPHNRGIWEMHP